MVNTFLLKQKSDNEKYLLTICFIFVDIEDKTNLKRFNKKI